MSIYVYDEHRSILLIRAPRGEDHAIVSNIRYYIQARQGLSSAVIRHHIKPARVVHCTAVIRDHGVATPALLCHRQPAQGTQSPILGALGRYTPLH